MGLLLGQDERVADWVRTTLGSEFYAPFVAIGITDDGGQIRGGLVFHHWNGANVVVAAGLERPFRRGEIRGIRHYAFEQLGAKRITFRPPANRPSVIRFLSRHATPEAVLPDWYPDCDAVQFVIKHDDPRWLKHKVEV